MNLLSNQIPVIFINNLHNIQQYDDGQTILFCNNSIQPINFSKIIYGPAIDFREVVRYCKNNQDSNVNINMLSPWNKNLARKFCPNSRANLMCLPFPVNVERFKPDIKENKAFIYFKHVEDYKLHIAINLINKTGIEYKIFRYGGYNESEYLDYIKSCKFGVWVGSHESQGFALEEALSCNCPLFILDVNSMKDECYHNNNFPWRNTEISYDSLEATTASYWNEECGMVLKNLNYNFLEDNFIKFLENLKHYEPRKFVCENLTTKNFINNIKEMFYL